MNSNSDFFKNLNANQAQREAIETTDGPVLIIAGPGTGKTFTLVNRIIYLIETGKAAAENIFIATFTEKAAKELVTRITDALAKCNITANLNEMYVGTFHSLCLRILKEHIEYTRLKKNYRTWEAFEQQYIVLQNYDIFARIPNIEKIWGEGNRWKKVQAICKYVNNLTEELVDTAELTKSEDTEIAALGHVMEVYQGLLEQQNALDFSAIQVEAYKLLCDYPEVLKKIQDKITHIMVDEYQDTNYIQEQLVFLLAGKKQNICVVGDDDQGLYRFRGATIRNILEFPAKFEEGKCHIVTLDTNYRSNSKIIDFYNTWMNTTDGKGFSFKWEDDKNRYRYPKAIKAREDNCSNETKSPAVVTITAGEGDYTSDEWNLKIKNFIMRLKNEGNVNDNNQIAFLFNSVKVESATKLATYLEDNGISVYSPRSGMYFKRTEIMLAIGLLILLFPKYHEGLFVYYPEGSFKNLEDAYKRNQMTICYFKDCVNKAKSLLEKPGNGRLRKWLGDKQKIHENLKKNTDYAYSKLLYQLFAFDPFAEILSVDTNSGVANTRAARNLAKLTEMVGRYEQFKSINILSPARIQKETEMLFNEYLRLLYKEGIDEYEDDSEYAPSGCVSFLTIHQSKGMEFPIVIVDSLWNKPWDNSDGLMQRVEAAYFKRKPFEPQSSKAFFDFWRLYYTAFSRAQNLLVLTCRINRNEKWLTPSVYFEKTYNSLPDVTDIANHDFDVTEFDFEPVKDVNIKKSFAFTSDISVYETCALQYKFYKELGFAAVRNNAMLFGTLVHETIEDIHKAVLRNEEDTITRDRIEEWFSANYDSLSMKEHSYLDEGQREAALQQVIRYARRQKRDWTKIRQAEVDVSLVKEDYIIEGKIDLIRGENGTVEIVDFKSEQKPDRRVKANREKMLKYQSQLNVYAALVEERTGQKVSRTCLYYTGHNHGDPVISFPYKKEEVEAAKAKFDETVHKILKKDYSHCATDKKVCDNCDFKWYCKKANVTKRKK